MFGFPDTTNLPVLSWQVPGWAQRHKGYTWPAHTAREARKGKTYTGEVVLAKQFHYVVTSPL